VTAADAVAQLDPFVGFRDNRAEAVSRRYSRGHRRQCDSFMGRQMDRRNFLKLCITSAVLAGCEVGRRYEKIGLALGGGGARGLAHVPMLEVLDDLGMRPHRIAGTSIGAVLGALYASGMSGRQIRDLIDRLTVSRDESWLGALFKEDVAHWWRLIEMQLGHGGLVDTKGFAGFIGDILGVAHFEGLGIPLKVVATDFWESRQVVFEAGDLLPALQATIAIPGLFSPVHHRGRVLVDGGLVNPVPYDLLFDECDLVIAIDVAGRRHPKSPDGPGYFETVFHAMQIMQASIVREKMAVRPPHVYIHPELNDIRVLDFNRVDEIYDQALPARHALLKALRR